jgi:hypothetical protein
MRIFDANDQNFAASRLVGGCFNRARSLRAKEVLVKSDYPSPHTPERKDEIRPPTSRFLDEKISDDSGAEANANSALAPAGLDNPFWN